MNPNKAKQSFLATPVAAKAAPGCPAGQVAVGASGACAPAGPCSYAGLTLTLEAKVSCDHARRILSAYFQLIRRNGRNAGEVDEYSPDVEIQPNGMQAPVGGVVVFNCTGNPASTGKCANFAAHRDHATGYDFTWTP